MEGKEFVSYRPDNLERLLTYYLEHENQRRQTRRRRLPSEFSSTALPRFGTTP